MTVEEIIAGFNRKDIRVLSKAISMVENETSGSEVLLSLSQAANKIPVIGITGPPGAGKSTLINSLLNYFVAQGKNIGVLAVDPTSPFTKGSLLGDRVRMSEHFTNEKVFIRSLATRGALGGLSAKSIEICEVMKLYGFDLILIETVGVGQSEVEIAGLADVTVLVLVPESGDEIQSIKSGVMEIADVYAINKSDREGSDIFYKEILSMAHAKTPPIPVVKTVAIKNEGVDELADVILKKYREEIKSNQINLLVEKAFLLLQQERMKGIKKEHIKTALLEAIAKSDFNLFNWVKQFNQKQNGIY